MFKYKLVKLRNLIARSPYEWVFFIFLFTNILVLTKIFGSEARSTALLLCVILAVINVKVKNLITSSILVSIYSLQFYVPNKYYVTEVLRSTQLSPDFGRYLLSYGLNLENIFIFICLILFIRNIITSRYFQKIYELKFIVPILISAFLYFFISLYSSLFISPHTSLSLVWLLQFMQLFVIAFTIFYIFIINKKKIELIIPVICSSLLLQGVISIFQFIKQSWMGLPVESFRINSTYYGGVDAVDSIFRTAGTFGHPNQLGILIVAMIILVIPFALKKRDPILILSIGIGILVTLLTQSRSSWIALFVTTILTFVFYKKLFLKFTKSFGIKRIIIYTALIIISTSFVLIPRVIRSLNVLNQGGSLPLRVEMVKEAKEAISLNIWTGYGIGTNEITLYKIFPRGYNYSFPAPVHNAYFQIMLESGIFGFIFFIFPFLYILRLIANSNRGINNTDYNFVILAGIASFAIFYIFLPHEGIREFAYLGIILGYGMIAGYQTRLIKK